MDTMTYYDLSGKSIPKPRFSTQEDIDEVQLDEGRFTLDCFVSDISATIKVNTSNGMKKMLKIVLSGEQGASFHGEVWQPHHETFLEVCTIGTCLRISFVPKPIYGNLFQGAGAVQWHARLNLDAKMSDIPPPGSKNTRRSAIKRRRDHDSDDSFTSNRRSTARHRQITARHEETPKCRRELCGKKKRTRRSSGESDEPVVARHVSKNKPHRLEKRDVPKQAVNSESSDCEPNSKPLKQKSGEKRAKNTGNSDSSDNETPSKDDEKWAQEIEKRIQADKERGHKTEEQEAQANEPSSTESDEEADDQTESDGEIEDTQAI